MKIDARALAALALSLSPVLWAADADKPGGKRICVPSDDGRTWVCGTPDSPPPARSLSEVRNSEPSPEPPMFLSNPDAAASAPNVDLSAPPPEPAPVDEFAGGGRAAPTTEVPDTADAAPIEEAAPVPSEPMPEPEPVVEPPVPSQPDIVGADAAQAGTPALLAAPSEDRGFPLAPTPSPGEPLPAESAPPEPEPASVVAEEPAAPDPNVAAPVEPEPIVAAPAPVAPEPEAAAPEPEPAASEPAPVASEPEPETETEPVVAETIAAEPASAPVVATTLASAPRNSTAFLAIAPGHYTLQLARAASQSGFATLLGTLGLRGEEAYSVPLSAGGAPSWLLLWGDFENLDVARAAAAQLAPRTAAWPRRAAPIQDELRAAGAR